MIAREHQPRRRRMDGLRSLARGRRADTPLLLFFGVNAVLLVLAGLITLIVLLVLWLM